MAYTNPIARVSTGNLATVNDANAGGYSQSDSAGRAPGQVGQIIELSEVEAQKMSANLHAGKYQYVLFQSGSSNANARGQVVEYATAAKEVLFTVNPDPTTAGLARPAGIALGAVSKGQYGWIQVAGLATVLCKASVTTTTDGTIGVYVSDTVGAVDTLADGTTTTNLQVKSVLGTFAEAPANGALKLFNLRDLTKV